MGFAECAAASLPPTAYPPFVISLVVPTQNCSVFREDQHCPSHSKITAARGVPALSNNRKTNISHSPQTLALLYGDGAENCWTGDIVSSRWIFLAH